MNAPQTAFPLDSTPSKADGKVEGAEMGKSVWRPICELPKDGTPVLVWSKPMILPDIAWHEEEGATLRSYTHWMPLPEPPTL
jgi:hypothetical protein